MTSCLIKPNLFAPAIFIMVCLVSDSAFAGSAVFACKEVSSREFSTVIYDAESKTKGNTSSNILPRRGEALGQPCAKTVEEVTAAGCKYFQFKVKLVEGSGASTTITKKKMQSKKIEQWNEKLNYKSANTPLLIFVATGCGTAK